MSSLVVRSGGVSPAAAEVLRLLTSRLIGIVRRFSVGSGSPRNFAVKAGRGSVVLSWDMVVDALAARVDGGDGSDEHKANDASAGGADDSMIQRSRQLLRDRQRESSQYGSFVDVLSNLLAQDLVEHLIELALREWLLQPLARLPAFDAKTRAMKEISAHFRLEKADRKSTYHLVLCTFSDLDWPSYEGVREAAARALASHLDTAEAMGALVREIGASVVDGLEARLEQQAVELEGVQQAMASTVKVFRGQNSLLADQLAADKAAWAAQLAQAERERQRAADAAGTEAAAAAAAAAEVAAHRQALDAMEGRLAREGGRRQHAVADLEAQVASLSDENWRAREGLSAAAAAAAARAAAEQQQQQLMQQQHQQRAEERRALQDRVLSAEAAAEAKARDFDALARQAALLRSGAEKLAQSLATQDRAYVCDIVLSCLLLRCCACFVCGCSCVSAHSNRAVLTQVRKTDTTAAVCVCVCVCVCLYARGDRYAAAAAAAQVHEARAAAAEDRLAAESAAQAALRAE
jgi:hypothetical protein